MTETADVAIMRSIQIDHGDGYRTDYTIAPGSVAVLLTAPGGRSWRGERGTLDDAIDLAKRMFEERRAADVVDKLAASWLFASDLEAKDAEIARLRRKIEVMETEHGKRQ